MWSTVGEVLAEVAVNHLMPMVFQEAVSQATQRTIGQGARWDTVDGALAVVGGIESLAVQPSGARVTIVSRIPGRVRYEVAGLRGNATLARAIEAQLAALAGVSRVEGNAITGRMLVLYEPTAVSTDRIAATISDVLPTARSVCAGSVAGAAVMDAALTRRLQLVSA